MLTTLVFLDFYLEGLQWDEKIRDLLENTLFSETSPKKVEREGGLLWLLSYLSAKVHTYGGYKDISGTVHIR